MKVLIIGTLPSSLTNFRGEFLKKLVRAGHEVHAMASGASELEVQEITSLGVVYHDYSIERSGLNPFNDLKTLKQFYDLFQKLKPELVLAYTIKPVIWGGIASRIAKVPQFHALVTGLGYAFNGSSFKRRVLKKMVSYLYSVALKGASSTIFQNSDNRATFLANGIVDEVKTYVVDGSGVDLSHFMPTALPEKNRFLLIARLLGNKGVREYVEAAKIVKSRYCNVEFELVGPTDPSPDGISLNEVQQWQESGVIIYRGAQNDVRPFIEQCRVFVLPSYHEGVPRTVLEAMSMKRPIITTRASGCKETVKEGENGWLVDVANFEQLADRMIWFINNEQEAEIMAEKSLDYVKERFDVRKINRDLFEILELQDEKSI